MLKNCGYASYMLLHLTGRIMVCRCLDEHFNFNAVTNFKQ